MNIKELKTICEALGIETLEDVQYFASREQQEGETLQEALKRYYLEFMEGRCEKNERN